MNIFWMIWSNRESSYELNRCTWYLDASLNLFKISIEEIGDILSAKIKSIEWEFWESFRIETILLN